MATEPRRPDWDTYFLRIAWEVAARGDCSRRQVGAVLVSPQNRILSTGYNGVAPGQPGCLKDEACPRAKSEVPPYAPYTSGLGWCIATHAEANAIGPALKRAAGATLYVTDAPCADCWGAIGSVAIARVVYPWSDRNLKINCYQDGESWALQILKMPDKNA